MQHVGPRYDFEFNGHLLFTRLLYKGEQTFMRPRPNVFEIRLAANVQKILPCCAFVLGSYKPLYISDTFYFVCLVIH